MSGFDIQLAGLAEKELEETNEWHEQRKIGLSSYFLERFEEGLKKISIHPGSYPFVLANKKLRKLHLKDPLTKFIS